MKRGESDKDEKDLDQSQIVYRLTQSNLKLLESFSIEEKLNFPLVAFGNDTFSIDGEVEENDCALAIKEDVEGCEEVALETHSFDKWRAKSPEGGASPKSARSNEVQN